MVQPAGVVTSSLSAAGCLPVANTISAAPSSVRAARVMATARGNPIITPPSANASIMM